jgi:hypothetical protein
MTRILLLGLDPETVDYSDPALPPGMTAEKVRAGVAVAVKQFTDRGWESDVGFIRPDETAGPTVKRLLYSAKLRLCGHWRRRAPAAPQPRIIRSRHQRSSKGRPKRGNCLQYKARR